MDSAPWDEEVFVMGESGCVPPHDKFIINAYRVKGWHNDEWNDAQGTRLSDAGWKPLFWSEISHYPDFTLATGAN
jgi:hypothetical protein